MSTLIYISYIILHIICELDPQALSQTSSYYIMKEFFHS